MLKTHSREVAVAAAIGALALVLAIVAPGYFSAENLRDLFLANLPVLLVAIGMTLVIVTGEIDISVGSVFAICAVAAGVLAKAGMPVWQASAAACVLGALFGSINGALVAYAGIPSIVVTLATMVALRDGLRWATEGAWVQNLPPAFQWMGLTQAEYPFIAALLTAMLTIAFAWGMRHVAAGRAIYATGSNPDAARLAGLDAAAVKCAVFTILGTLTGLAAVLNAVRFNQIPSNAGIGLEMKVIASVVVGGACLDRIVEEGVCFVLDISERKATEEEVRHLAQSTAPPPVHLAESDDSGALGQHAPRGADRPSLN
jgi:rhamnose transport system permease protein